MAEYSDILTLDGRIKAAHPSVTKRKLEAAGDLLSRALRGDHIASGTMQEVLTTSDLQFNLAHLVSAELLPQFDAAPRTWSEIATTRVVKDFDSVKLFGLFGDLAGPGIRQGGGAARVPEAAPYPYATIAGKEAFHAKIGKNGFKFGYTWESRINDIEGFFADLPSQLLSVALDTEEAETYDALIEGVAAAGASVELHGGTLPDGAVVLPNAKVTPSAIWQAILELQNRVVNGRKVGAVSGYNVIVPTGRKAFVDYALRQQVIAIQDGNITFGPSSDTTLNNVTVIESDKIGLTNADEWYILPKPGTLRRPVLELARLRGHETPELRVENAAGNYLGGGAVSPFEGNFTNDTIDYRLRYVAGGILWDSTFVLYSDGSGTV